MPHSIRHQIWKTQQWPQDWKKSFFIPIPRKGNVKECSNYHTIALISHASKFMLKILLSEAPVVHEPRTSRCINWIQKSQKNQRSNCQHSLDHRKSKGIPKAIYFCFTDYTKAFVWITRNCGNLLTRRERQTLSLPPEKPEGSSGSCLPWRLPWSLLSAAPRLPGRPQALQLQAVSILTSTNLSSCRAGLAVA